mgnify:CR=1 FL=1
MVARDIPVDLGGVTVRSGDIILADEDGVVVVPQEAAEQVLQAALEKVESENQVRDAIRSGMAATAVFEKYGIL